MQTRLGDHPALLHTLENEKPELNQTRNLLNKTTRRVDRNSKRWDAAWFNFYPEDSPERDALSQIETEQGTSAPTAQELGTLTQIDNNVAVTYVAGGGDHATTIGLLWQVVGIDEDFGHATPVNLEGQTVGPFLPGAEILFKTLASNSAGEAESEVKSITLQMV